MVYCSPKKKGEVFMGDSDFLSLKEAAEYLNVKYKTVYRLVRDGRLPAVKIGGVYRIRRQDLEAYVELQRIVPPQVSIPRCSICGRPIASELSLGGYCQAEGCNEPICFACWQWEHQRFCPVHQAERSTPKEGDMSASSQVLRCGTCFRVIPSPEMAGGQCEAEGCDAWICVDCWNKPDGHFCREHKPSREQKLAEARQRLAQGLIPCLVTDLEARKREVNFLNRFNYKVQRVGSIRHPLTGRALRVADWEAYRTSGDETDRLLELMGVGYLDKDLLARTPINEWSRYRVVPSGDVPELVLEARTFSHLEAYVRQGFDTQPATVEDLVALLNTYIKESEQKEMAYVVGLASTTGWDERTRTYIQGERTGEAFFHRHVLPLLVDLETGEVVYNEQDDRLAPLAPLFAPQLQEELVHAAVRQVEELLFRSPANSLTVSQATAALGIEEEVIQRAFEQLARLEKFSIDDIQGIGRTLIRKEE